MQGKKSKRTTTVRAGREHQEIGKKQCGKTDPENKSQSTMENYCSHPSKPTWHMMMVTTADAISVLEKET